MLSTNFNDEITPLKDVEGVSPADGPEKGGTEAVDVSGD